MDFKGIEYVFLDRDGVLNRKPPLGQYVTCCEDLQLLPGVEQAVAALNRSGRKIIVVTNQRGIALGLYSLEDLEAMHCKLRQALAVHGAHLDAIYSCPHDNGQCNCRKPLPGLFQQAFAAFPGAQPFNSLMVGDSLRDIEAGLAMGMMTVFVTGSGSPGPDSQRAASLAQLTVACLPELVQGYLATPRR